MQRGTRQNRQQIGRGSFLSANSAPRALRRRDGRQRLALPIEPLESRVLLAMYTVSTLADESDGNFTWGDFSLREAIEQSNASAGADQIDFASGMAGTITLDPALGELYVSGDTTINGPGYAGFAMTWVDVVGEIVDIPSATAILNSTPPAVPAPYVYQGHASDSYPYIDFGAGGVSPIDMAFPGGTVSTEEFALRAYARVYIPAGTWTVALGTDDGFMLTIPGINYSLVFSSQRPYAHTLGSFTVPAGGLYTSLTLDMYENHGAEAFEFFIAPGAHIAYDPASFMLASNGAFGWTFTNDLGWRPDELALTVVGNNATTRVLHVGPSGSAIIDDLAISGGYSTTHGGGVLNEGFLRLEKSAVRNSVSLGFGGGIYNANTATIILEKAWVMDNDSDLGGGGIANEGSATINLSDLWSNTSTMIGGGGAFNSNTMTIMSTDLFDNRSGWDGGAIYNAPLGSVEISDSNIMSSQAYNGGAIRNDAYAVVRNTYFQDNTAMYQGGTILNYSGADAYISGGMIRNAAAEEGGGIWNSGTMNVEWFDIENATARQRGGAVYNYGSGTLTANYCDFVHNLAGSDGGGIYNTSILTFTSGAIAYNTSGNYGGGLFGYSGSVVLLNSTISNNAAAGVGGGIHGNGSSLYLLNSTIAENRADSDGDTFGWAGGLYAPVAALLHNTLIARNTRGLAATADDASGNAQAASTDNILAAGGLTGLNPAINLIGTSTSPIDAKIGPLADNGGYTLTHMLLAGSPAVDAGIDSAATAAGLVHDQRRGGYSRFVGPVDIGAVEVAFPSSLVVDILGDENDGNYAAGDLSLREAIEIANSRAGHDNISFAAGLSGTIVLTLGELTVRGSTFVNGPGITLSGNNASRIINVASSASVEFRSMNMEHGQAPASSGQGGAILNHGTLLLVDDLIADNVAVYGAGLYNAGNAYTIDSEFSANNASWAGGGIYNAAQLQLNATILSANTGGISGGAIHNDSAGSVSIDNSILAYNVAVDSSFGSGGGVGNYGSITITNSTIFGCGARGTAGGAIYNGSGASAKLINSTLSGNLSWHVAGAIYSGGQLNLTNVTATENRGDYDNVGGGGYGGLYLAAGGSALFHNTIIARNYRGSTGATIDEGIGTVLSASSNNLIGTPVFAGISNGVNGNRIGTLAAPLDPKLGPLAGNGGRTQTHALLAGSPAVNNGNNARAVGVDGNPLIHDQRGSGYPRFVGTVDIGAFEDQSSMPIAKPGGPYTIAEGQSLSLNGSASVNASSYAWDVNSDGVFTDATGATPTLTWTQLNALGINNGPASRTVSLRVTDAGGNTNTASTNLSINNAPPTAAFSVSAASVNEGSAVTFKFTNQNDPSLYDQLAPYTYSYDLNGDGDYTDGFPVDVVVYSDSINPVMNESGMYSIHGRITDRDGGYSDYTVALTVKNLAPKVLAGPDLSASVGVPLTLSGSFTDVAADGPWTATVSYGDVSTVYPLTLSGQNFSLSHTYTKAGSYNITVKVTDKNGGVGSDIVTVTLPVASSPTASLTSFAAPVLGSSAAVNLVVRYSDDVLLNAATIGAGDISVLAPNGTILATTFVSKTSAVNAAVISATYSLKPPGGGVWDSPDNGLYQVLLNGRQVADTSSPVLYAAPRTLGSSTVNLSPVLIVSGVLTVYGTASGDSITLTTSGSTYSVLRNGITYSGTGSFTKVRLAGLEGNDILTYNGTLPGTLEGAAGDDILNGGSGGDQLYGGAGSDKLAGGSGNDAYWFESASAMEREEVVEAAGGGTDRLDFSKLPYWDGVMVDLSGATTSIVQHLNRVVTATLTTAANIENLTGGSGPDDLIGNALVNAVTGNAGNDLLRGEGGNDVLNGGEGSDALIGGAGNDSYTFVTAATVQSDWVDEQPGGGVDTLNFASLAATDPLWVDLRSDEPMARHKNRLVWSSAGGVLQIENVNGGAGADQIWGNAAANVLKAGGGNDWIFSRDAIKDMVDGGVGMDTAEADVLDLITTAEVIHR